jgi:uncharacterized membrane protein (UPF0127 family)
MRVIPVLLLAVVLAACSSSDDSGASTTVTVDSAADTTTTVDDPPETSTTTTQVIVVPPELADHDLDMVVVGEQLLLLAIADSPGLRSQGLMGVADLGDLDGMLFYWRHEAHGGFWMKDTLIPLDIVWFNVDGTYAGRASMVPCTEDPCPTYEPEGNPDFRFAIEARPGDLDWVDESTIIVYSD